MLVDFKLPDLGEGIDSGDVVRMMVKVGDEIRAEQPLVELETGKAVVEVPSNTAGRVAAILTKEGEKVTVGQPLVKIETDASADISKVEAVPAPEPEKERPPQVERSVPPARDHVSPQLRQPAPASPAPGTASNGGSRDGVDIPASPIVRRMARERGIDLSTVKGSGSGGRITEEDLKTAQAPRPIAPTMGAAAQLPDFSRWGNVERKPMTSVRQATAEHLTRAWTTIPQVTQYDHADVTELDVLRKRYAANVEQMGGKLTVTAVLLKVVASALRQFPRFNTSVDMPARAIIAKDYVNVGVAVNTERGLLVPVIRDADKKNILDLSVELAKLTERAHKRELKPADLEGGTFSITNLGTIGGTHFTPIINWPEVSILGISRGAMEPVWKEDKFEPRLLLPLSLSYDHRVIDGADGARFLRWICEALEQPFFLALEG
ncbi:MAG TPA: 2-oxo acid dehydrogenase subunit E2 [bacterium]|jgi:pyruvate dehydrogenase E2 component (dihydrolipoamide acetyltransferase)